MEVHEIRTSEIYAHLRRVLASAAFRSSKRSYRFLEFVVTQVLEGKASSLKERILATEVFDRSEAFDSGDDTIVRVGAREVRKRLAQYYTSSDGANEKVRITLPIGCYVPEFVQTDWAKFHRDAFEGAEDGPVPMARRRPWGVWLLAGAAAVSVLVGLTLSQPFTKRTSFEDFWLPLWHSPAPVLISVANPLVYHPSSRAGRLNEQKLGPSVVPMQRPLQLPPNELNGSDFIPAPDQYVGYGDLLVVDDVSVLLARHAKDTHVRLASQLMFSDFREGPAILIGAYTNRWTLELTQPFQFHFGFDRTQSPAILDSADSKHVWSIPLKEDNGFSPEDFFLVSRILNSSTGAPLVVAAGLTQFGTEAAGRFLGDQARMNEMLPKVGDNWQTRNMELVFYARVIGNSPSAYKLVASHVW
jgi:hypothetical protein